MQGVFNVLLFCSTALLGTFMFFQNKKILALEKEIVRFQDAIAGLDKIIDKLQKKIHWYSEKAKLCTCGAFKKR